MRKFVVARHNAKPTMQAPPSAAEQATAHAAEIASICNAAAVPDMAAGLIREGVTLDQARERAGGAEAIRVCCRMGEKINTEIFAPNGHDAAARDFIAAYVAGRITVDMVRTMVLDRLVDLQSPEIRGTIAADAGFQTAANHGWDKIFANVYANRAKAMGQGER